MYSFDAHFCEGDLQREPEPRESTAGNSMAKKIQADLHVHTNYSDSTLSPREVVDHAVTAGLNMIAITDHDTTAGIAEAQQHGRTRDVDVVAGVEISTYHGEQEFHIVGLYVDTVNPSFLEKLEQMRRARHERIFEIAEKLKKLGIDIDGQEIIDLADGNSPGRAHVAQALMNRGHVSDFGEAFYRFVGDTGPAFVPKRFITVEESIASIRSMSGVSILAHPGLTNRDDFIPMFAEMGLNGLEAFYPTYNREQTTHYLSLAQKLGLLASGGSDCHGRRKPEIMIGRVRVPELFVQRITALAQLLPGSLQHKEDNR